MGCHDAEDGEKGEDGMPSEGEEELAKGQTIALISLHETVFGIALELVCYCRCARQPKWRM